MTQTTSVVDHEPRPADHPAARRQPNNIVAIASGKGGVGKTWLAITLSHALARKGTRTLLFDGDLGLANVDVQLGLMPAQDLDGVVEGRIGLSQAIVSFAPGFDIVAGRSGSGALANLERRRLDGIREELALLAGRYDRVILDLGAGIDDGVRALAASGGTLLVVTTDEPTALTDAYAFIKLTVQKNPPPDLRVVINLASGHRDGERTYAKLRKACESFLKVSPPLAGVIRRDDRVREAIRHQTSLLTRHPTTEAAVDVETIVARLTGPP